MTAAPASDSAGVTTGDPATGGGGPVYCDTGPIVAAVMGPADPFFDDAMRFFKAAELGGMRLIISSLALAEAVDVILKRTKAGHRCADESGREREAVDSDAAAAVRNLVYFIYDLKANKRAGILEEEVEGRWVLNVTCLFGFFHSLRLAGASAIFVGGMPHPFHLAFYAGHCRVLDQRYPPIVPPIIIPILSHGDMPSMSMWGLALWWIRMPSITGESRRPTDLQDFFPVSLTPPLKLSILLLFLSPARCMWLSRMALRRWQGLRNTLLQAFAMSGSLGGMRLLDGPNRRAGGASTASGTCPPPPQRRCRATRMDAQASPQRTDQRQKTRPRAAYSAGHEFLTPV